MSSERGEIAALGLQRGEVGLLVFLIATASYMFVGSYQYPAVTGFFPRLTGGIVIIGCILLLFRNFFPQSVSDWLEGQTVQADMEEELDLPGVDDESPTSEQEQEADDDHVPEFRDVNIGPAAVELTVSAYKQLVLVILIAGYIILSYLIGMLWATPIFMLVYTMWAKLEWYFIAALPPAAFFLAWSFTTLLNLPTRVGYIHDLIGGFL